jgi:hypothetical protein
MPISPSLLPDCETLTAGLTAVFSQQGSTNTTVTIDEREPNLYATGSRSEIVTCRLERGRRLRLFCKYEAKDALTWSDVAYEGEVYRHVLQPTGSDTPVFYGTYREEATGKTWLILEHLEQSRTLDEVSDSARMALAARWLGRFHAATEALATNATLPFLKQYGAAHYRARARLALSHAGPASADLPWVSLLGERFEALVMPLVAARPAITHGDCYQNNILCRGDAVYPIDWEHSGIDLGEMDLACLTVGWRGETEQRCLREYQQARWPQGVPADFERTLAAARLCLFFDKLSGQPNWTSNGHCLWYCKQLRAVAERLGLI